MAKKLKRVKVMTQKGERVLVFRPIKDIPTEQVICETECPYGKICDKIIDPRNPNNPDFKFTDFCGDLGEIMEEESESEKSKNEDLTEYVPVEGTIEENLYDFPDIFQTLIEKNPMVRISDVIDKCCSSWCDSYTKDHSNCNTKNKLCIMHDLFKNDRFVKKDDN